MRLLLLAGTAEARQIARALALEERVRTVASLAGATRQPEPLGVATRIGGFGGRDNFRDYLRRETIDAVLDATHPFASVMSHRTFEVCAELDLPYLQFLRRAWTPDPGDKWAFLNNEAEVAQHVPEGARVLLATGSKSLHLFGPLEGRMVFARGMDVPDDPLPFQTGEWLRATPTFRLADERALLDRLSIDWVVARNSGGSSSRIKLDAARDLGVPVAMIRRPLQPPSPRVSTVSSALNWVRAHL